MAPQFLNFYGGEELCYVQLFSWTEAEDHFTPHAFCRKDNAMIYAKDRIIDELDGVSAQLASLMTDLKACRAVLHERLKKPLSFLPLEDYDCHFADAFTHIEKAKMAVRALQPLCHQANFLKKKTEKGRHR